jgi:GNAT superfamily N-acetyltransferase
MERTVRPCGPQHAVVVGTLLAEAFLDDPVMHWMQPIPARRPATLRRLFVAQLRHEYLPASGVQMIGDPAGQPLAAAVWKPPDTTWSRTSRREQLAMTAGVVVALRTRVPAALTVRGALERAHPTEPHWYLNKLGTAPAARGQGLASALLSAQLRHCDNTATPAYLEATQHPLIGFYETVGFTCTDPIDVPHGGPRLWGMWRAPR